MDAFFAGSSSHENILSAVQGATIIILAHAKKNKTPLEWWRLAGRVSFLLANSYPAFVLTKLDDEKAMRSLLEECLVNLTKAGIVEEQDDMFVLGESGDKLTDNVLVRMEKGLKQMEAILIDTGMESLRQFLDESPEHIARFAISVYERTRNPVSPS